MCCNFLRYLRYNNIIINNNNPFINTICRASEALEIQFCVHHDESADAVGKDRLSAEIVVCGIKFTVDL